jgi:putative ABC transport system substrate-binding protein
LKFFPRLLRQILPVIFILVAAQISYAGRQIGVIMSGDIPYYDTMHESFVTELNKSFAGEEKIELILQKPFPNPISWSNAARKLIAFDVDLIVTYGFPATEAVLHENSRIPLVYAGLHEPDLSGPTRKNVTGCGFKIPISSILRYLKGLKTLNTLGIIFSSVEDDSIRQYQAMKELADSQSIKTEKIDLRVHADLDGIKRKNLDAVFITGSSLAHLWLDGILSILKKEKVPSADIFPDDSESEVLITLFHPPNMQGQKAAEMATQIMRGTPPGNIPAHTFRDTELVLNLVEARYLGITFPIQLLISATKVIE